MLTFEIIQTSKSDAIQVSCDEDGISSLIDALNRLKTQGHVHLRSPSAGGKDISDVTDHGKQAVAEVIITLV